MLIRFGLRKILLENFLMKRQNQGKRNLTGNFLSESVQGNLYWKLPPALLSKDKIARVFLGMDDTLESQNDPQFKENDKK